jgi:guanylate kinase
MDELVRRLVGRGTESQEQRARRLESARAEMAAQAEFDHVIVNREIRQAADELVALLGL